MNQLLHSQVILFKSKKTLFNFNDRFYLIPNDNHFHKHLHSELYDNFVFSTVEN